MKTVKIIFIALITIALSVPSNAQSNDSSKKAVTKTETLQVSGKCGMCKTRIEKTAKAEGASKAEWDQQTKILTVTFDPSKTNLEQIGKKIAAVGHDNPVAKADDKVYDALPGCCKYR
jgi:periplasmic mercuric ion binding protein